MLSERFGFSKAMDDSNAENAIWQCPEIMTVQVECTIMDNRTGEHEPFTVFFCVEDEMLWKKELTRILDGLGYTLCLISNHFVRKTTLSAFNLHQVGKPLED